MNYELIIATASIAIAILSALFSWKSAQSAERSNRIGIFSELHQLYHSEKQLKALQTVWRKYEAFYEVNGKYEPLTLSQAYQIVKETDHSSEEWKAIHDTSVFWKYIALLVREKYLDKEIAFNAFTSPKILGFLHPIEKAFINDYKLDYDYKKSLEKLYDTYKIESKRGI